jgi:hypothetical protein
MQRLAATAAAAAAAVAVADGWPDCLDDDFRGQKGSVKCKPMFITGASKFSKQ